MDDRVKLREEKTWEKLRKNENVSNESKGDYCKFWNHGDYGIYNFDGMFPLWIMEFWIFKFEWIFLQVPVKETTGYERSMYI